jgi:hypothetical protein
MGNHNSQKISKQMKDHPPSSNQEKTQLKAPNIIGKETDVPYPKDAIPHIFYCPKDNEKIIVIGGKRIKINSFPFFISFVKTSTASIGINIIFYTIFIY